MSDLLLISQRGSSSGLPEYLERAFQARGLRVAWVDAMSVLLPRVGPLLRSFSLSKARWYRKREILEYYTLEAWERNTRVNGRLVERAYRPGTRILQVGGLYYPHPDFKELEYYLFFTYTMRLALRDGHSPWVVTAADRDAFLRNEEQLYRHAKHIFVSAQFVKDHLIADYGIPAERITTVGMGVGEYYERNTIPEVPSRLTGQLLFVGYTFDLKGGPDVLKAFAKARAEIPDLRLEIIGPPPRPDMQMPGVQPIGQVRSAAELLAHYRAADLFLLPSYCDSFGFVFLEAMSQGLPCLGANINAMPEIIEDGKTGYIVEPGDSDAIARCILDLYRNPERRVSMGEAGRARLLERFRWSRVVERMHRVMFEESPADDRRRVHSG